MRKTLLSGLIITLAGCGQQTTTVASGSPQKDAAINNGKAYTVHKAEQSMDEEQAHDSTFVAGGEKYTVTVKNYTKGDYTIADTSDHQITLYKEEFIDITINGKTVTISKPMFADIYPNKSDLYHSGFGTAYIDSIDTKNKKVIFGTFCGFHQSDFGEMLYYSVSFDGKYEFIKAKVPEDI